MARKPKKVMLNLGCGNRILAGPEWINVDNFTSSKAANFRKADIRSLPFERDFADYILIDNVLEHIPMADIPAVLWEVRRVLKVGGRAVIMVPDFSCLARNWLKMEETECFNPYVYQWIAETIYGHQFHEGEFHKTPMSPQYLNYVLRLVGFRKYELVVYPAGGPLPSYPGMSGPQPGQIIRNDQLAADVEKTL